MESIRKSIVLHDIGEGARRQYIDAQATFMEWERTLKNAAEVRGGMYWKKVQGREYLIRTSTTNAQKSLGPRSPETEAIYQKFIGRKEALEARLKDIKQKLSMLGRLNRALFVGRAPQMLVDILAELDRAGIADYFRVVGTHALYAYEAAAGVRIASGDALATQDIDLLWDTRKRFRFTSTMERANTSMLGVLKKVDRTFEIKPNQRYTAVNSQGIEVDIIRREAKEGDPHPLQITDDEDDFWVAQATKAGLLLDAPRLSAMIVSASGGMARMTTVSPVAFARFKRWLSEQPGRDTMKRGRDALQAEIVEQLVAEYLPNLVA